MNVKKWLFTILFISGVVKGQIFPKICLLRGSNLVMRLLWFIWGWSLCVVKVMECLSVSVSHEKIFYRLDGVGMNLFFSSLYYRKGPTTMNLSRLLSTDNLPIKINYYTTEFSETTAKELVGSFINVPALHPIVLPFALYSKSKTLQSALDPYLDFYRPGILSDFKMFGEIIEIDDKALLAIAKNIPNLYINIAVPSIARQLFLADREQYRELRELADWTFDEFSAVERINVYGKTFGFISILYNLLTVFTKKRGGSFSNTRQVIIDHTSYAEYFDNYFGLDSWDDEYAQLKKLVESDCKNRKLNDYNCAFWQGRLLEIFARHKSFRLAKLEERFVSYLDCHSYKRLPLTVLFGLDHAATQKGLSIHPNNNKKAILALDYLDTLLPFGSFMRYDISRHVNQIYNWNKFFNRTKSLNPPHCSNCSAIELINWWSDFKETKSIILVSLDTFPVISIDTGQSKIICNNLYCLLHMLSEILLHNAQSVKEQTDEFVYAKAYVRTFVYSLLYRMPVELQIDEQSICALYGHGIDNNPISNFKGSLLRKTSFFMMPKKLFLDYLYYQMILKAKIPSLDIKNYKAIRVLLKRRPYCRW